MTFETKLTRIPVLNRPNTSQDARLGLVGSMGDLLEAASASSPYLARLIRIEAEWLLEAVLLAPNHVWDRLMASCAKADGSALRCLKRRVALYTALCDLGGVWKPWEVTRALTEFADKAVAAAYRPALLREIKRGALPGQTEADIETGCGLVILAMGKMGAYELNYSSDIDLICLFDETRIERDDFSQARQSLVRATRAAMKTLSEVTAEGYVFRTDLRLRPDPSVTPVCLSLEAAERYYESLGRTWERAAHIKARVAYGDQEAGAAYLERLRPFVFRKHLDFAAIEDAHDIRLKIRAHKGTYGKFDPAGHDLKLGRGGIREIEFFAQTQQLIAGGRDPSLRCKGTVQALEALCKAGWLSQEIATRLAQQYWSLRDLEHRVQMIQDAQTHCLPSDPSDRSRVAALSGFDTLSQFDDFVRSIVTEVSETISPFYEERQKERDTPTFVSTEFAQTAAQTMERWHSYPCLRSERARALFDKITPQILSSLEATGAPQEALAAFDRFLGGLPSGVQIFSLFQAQPQLIALLADICALSQDLAQYLARNASVLDAVLDGNFFQPIGDAQSLAASLSRSLAPLEDYERRLDQARRWHKDLHFRIGVQFLREVITAREAGKAYARLAEAVLIGLWPVVHAEFERRYGRLPGRGAALIAMGSLGAGRLTARSDLDLIVVYDVPEGHHMSDGPKALTPGSYYAKFTQSLITALSALTAEGRLYEVDMRLRPSGRQGPVATTLSSFAYYQHHEAWVWEHLALTRARVICAQKQLAQDIEAIRDQILHRGAGLSKTAPRAIEIWQGLSDMRKRLAQAASHKGPLSFKHGAGRMQDIELFAQALMLLPPKAKKRTEQSTFAQLGLKTTWLSPSETECLRQTYGRLADLQQATKLLADHAPQPDTIAKGAERFFTAQAQAKNLSALLEDVSQASQSAAHILDHCLEDVLGKAN